MRYVYLKLDHDMSTDLATGAPSMDKNTSFWSQRPLKGLLYYCTMTRTVALRMLESVTVTIHTTRSITQSQSGVQVGETSWCGLFFVYLLQSIYVKVTTYELTFWQSSSLSFVPGVPLDISDILGRVEKYLQESGSTRMKRETGYAKVCLQKCTVFFFNFWFQEYKMERDGVGMGIAYDEASDKEGYFFFRVKDVCWFNFENWIWIYRLIFPRLMST